MTEEAACARPVDLVHLSRRTAGDRALEREVLSGFVRQCDLYLDRLHEARDATARRSAAHALVGSARAIGAFELARAAWEVEAETVRDCGRVDREAAQAARYIAGLLRVSH